MAKLDRENILRDYMGGKSAPEIAVEQCCLLSDVENIIDGRDVKSMEKAGIREGEMIREGLQLAKQVSAGTPISTLLAGSKADQIKKSMQKAAAVTSEYEKSPILYPNIYAAMQKKKVSLTDIGLKAGASEGAVYSLLCGRPTVTLDYKYTISPKNIAIVDALLELCNQPFDKLFLRDKGKSLVFCKDPAPRAVCVYPKVEAWMEREHISCRGLAAYAGTSSAAVCHLLAGEVAIMDDILMLRAKKPVTAAIVRTILNLSGLSYQDAFLSEWPNVEPKHTAYMADRRAKDKIRRIVAASSNRVLPMEGNESDFIDFVKTKVCCNHYAVISMRPEDLFVGTRHISTGNWDDMYAMFLKRAGERDKNTQLLAVSGEEQMVLAYIGCDGSSEIKWVYR